MDFVNTAAVSPEIENTLLENLVNNLPTLDAFIISDYQPIGIITDNVFVRLNAIAKEKSTPFFVVDSRERIGKFKNMILKPNSQEALHTRHDDASLNYANDAEIEKSGKVLQERTGKPVFLTLGKNGCLVLDGKSTTHINGIKVSPPIDTVGAGDAFLASLTACLAAGASPVEAGFIANLAAAITIKKLHCTGTASPEEIISLYETMG